MPAIPLGMVSLPVANPIAVQFARMNITQAFRVFADSVDIASRQMAELRLALDEPELIIRPDVNGINLLDKVNVRDLAKCGEDATRAVLPKLIEAVSYSARLKRQLRWVLRQI